MNYEPLNKLLIRYWFYAEKAHGVGVTAFSIQDAITLVNEQYVAMLMEPNFNEVIENIDITTLDQGHVIPNMGPVSIRGVWYPRLNI